MFVGEEVVPEHGSVHQGLEDRVHEAGVAQVVESTEACVCVVLYVCV